VRHAVGLVADDRDPGRGDSVDATSAGRTPNVASLKYLATSSWVSVGDA
jgi:hypothetical protein